MTKMYYDPLFTDRLIFPTNSIRVSYQEDPEPVRECNPVAVIELADGNTIPVLQGRPGGGRLKAIDVPLTEADVKTFASLRDLLTTVFDRLGVIVPSQEQQAQEREAGTYTSPIEIAIKRQADYIAARTRRGEGNTLLVGLNPKLPIPEGYTALHTDALRDNEVIILYRGEEHGVVDGPFLAELSLDGTVRAFVLNNRATCLGNAMDYGCLIEAVEHSMDYHGMVLDVREL